MSRFIQELWNTGTPVQQSAMAELEARGLSFLSHFGTENANSVCCGLANETMAWERFQAASAALSGVIGPP